MELSTHEAALIGQQCEIGAKSCISRFGRVMKRCRTGQHCATGQDVAAASGGTVGNVVKIQYCDNVMQMLHSNSEPNPDGYGWSQSLDVLIAGYFLARDGRWIAPPLEF